MNNKQKTLYYTLIIIVLIITDITLFTKNQSLSEEIIIKDQIITEQAQLLQLTDDLKLKVISLLEVPIYKHYYAIGTSMPHIIA